MNEKKIQLSRGSGPEPVGRQIQGHHPLLSADGKRPAFQPDPAPYPPGHGKNAHPAAPGAGRRWTDPPHGLSGGPAQDGIYPDIPGRIPPSRLFRHLADWGREYMAGTF